jgi:hypothetical protein
MASHQDDVDLDKVLKDPQCARDWLKYYDWGPDGPPIYIVYGIEGKIYLENMTDDEAVTAAYIILSEEKIKWFKVKRMLEEIEVH